MKITMLDTIRGSLDGETVIELLAGQDYETVDSARGDRLAKAHIGSGAAVATPEVALAKIEITKPGKPEA